MRPCFYPQLRTTLDPVHHQMQMQTQPAKCGVLRAYLWVGVQDADASSLNHLLDGVSLDSVQVAFVLSVFQIAPVLDVSFHLAAAGESKHATFSLTLFGFS